MRNMEKNLKIRMRLLIVFLITILIALALTFLSIRQTIKIQKDYTSILTAHAETDHLRKFIRSRHADAEPEAPAYTNPDSEDFGYGRPA